MKVEGEDLADVKAMAEMYDATVVDSTGGTITVEVTGSEGKVEAAIESFERFGVREIARAGTVALERGARETARKRPQAATDGTGDS